MTVQNLYTQYLDGKITKQKFLYEVRRDQHLDMISPNNSFDDVVKILKNKSIISEKAHKEAKLATGKQEVDIIAKTIDMVNPYEYSRGMDYELDIMDVPATSGDLSDDNVLKAQKKVLANLTKNPTFYFDKINGKGEVTEEWVEATKKEIDKIGKGKKNIMREGINPKQIQDLLPGIPTDVIIDFIKVHGQDIENATDEEIKDEFENFRSVNYDYLNEHGEYADRVADVMGTLSPLEEKQEAIYKKYAEATGIPMENLMSMVREAKAKIKEDTFLGKDSLDDLKKHQKYSTLSSDGKKDAEDELKKGGSVTIG